MFEMPNIFVPMKYDNANPIQRWVARQIILQLPPKSVTREKSIGFRGKTAEERKKTKKYWHQNVEMYVLQVSFGTNTPTL